MSTAESEIALSPGGSADCPLLVQPMTSHPSSANRLAAALPTYPQPAIRTRGISFQAGSGNLNLAKLAWLDRAHLLQTNQFEERKKRNHDFNARRHFREQLGKFQCSTLADAGQNRFDFIGDSVVLAEN